MTFSNIFTVIARNLKIYSNSKLSSLIIIIGPLMLMMIMGVSLQDNSLKNVKAGVFLSDEEYLGNSFIDLLKERSFEVNVEDSLESCKENVIEEINHVCIHIKENQLGLGSISTDYKSYDVDIYVDFSKQRIVWGIISTIQGAVEQESYSTRKILVNDIRNNVGNLNSRIITVENGLNSALAITSSLKEKNLDVANDLGNLKLILSDTKQSLETIKNSGVLGEPHASTLSDTITDLNSSGEKLSNIEKNQIAESEIRDIENSLQNTKNSVTTIKQEINRLDELDVDRLADPIILSYYSVSDDQEEGTIETRLESLDYLFPSFLIFFLLFDSLIFSTVVTIKERSSNSYIRNITSKNSGITFIGGNLITVLLLILIQISIILFIASFFLNLDVLSNLYSLIPIILISILIFSLMGIFIGYLFNSYESAIISSISLSLLLFIFSSIISPAETLPGLLSEIIKLSPLTLMETKLRIALIFNSFFGFDLNEILSLSGIFLFLCVLIGVFYKKSKETEI